MSYTPGAMTVGIEPHVLVIFGGTGDLARRKLLPALYELLRRRDFHDKVEVLAVATRDQGDDEYRRMVAESLREGGIEDPEEWCEEVLHYQSIEGGFDALARRVADLEATHGLPGNRAFYLAIPPAVFDDTVEGLGKSGLLSTRGWVRVVVEKPFGFDIGSARHLNVVLHRWFEERQIYRIDHYLAKESVQNLLALRFANPIFESVWNRDRIDSVQITVAEDIGIGSRAGYYDGTGAVRDVIQNHGLQILSLVAMEPPVRLEPGPIRDEKVKVLRAMHPLEPQGLVRGQYVGGNIDGEEIPGYREEDGVADASTTETFVAVGVSIDSWRWKGVPFYIRAGKRMTGRVTEVAVVFQDAPVCLFEVPDPCNLTPNVFSIRLQPAEGFDLAFEI